MTPDLHRFIEKLAERPAKILAPALADPELAKEAFILSLILGFVAQAVDHAPGRLRREGADVARIIATYAAHARNEAEAERYTALLEAPWNDDTLTGMVARDRKLKAALIDIEIALEPIDAEWARQLHLDILAAYLRWTEPTAPSR